MQRLSLAILALLCLCLTLPATAEKAWKAAPELLFVGPLDPAVVTVDSMLDILVLASAQDVRKAPTEGALVARTFFPAFGAAVSMAARKVAVIDSSGASLASVRSARTVLVQTGTARKDTVRIAIPAYTQDSARYALVLGSLDLSQASETKARQYVSPPPSSYDPAIGMTIPGNRKGYSEGPGRVTTLTARAGWVLWDNTAQAPAARGVAVGAASSRSEPGKTQWVEAARELAKDILRQTAFTPF